MPNTGYAGLFRPTKFAFNATKLAVTEQTLNGVTFKMAPLIIFDAWGDISWDNLVDDQPIFVKSGTHTGYMLRKDASNYYDADGVSQSL